MRDVVPPVLRRGIRRRSLTRMATWDDVRELALSLPEASEHVSSRGKLEWKVRAKAFVLERPLRRADLDSLGIAEQRGPVLAAKTEDEAVKLALTTEDPSVFFTTPHFDGYATVLVHLDRIPRRRLSEVVAEAWAATAPEKLVREYLRHNVD
ncbi:MmcQ/YjbR family DNA-binding protein [Agromyces salentinus]|uniref:MmcQ/YjbR family DNA-binding protein n=2 Tax=Agromyces salentinus TaxID=269421 RepID=A0ABN2MIR3_9MICO